MKNKFFFDSLAGLIPCLKLKNGKFKLTSNLGAYRKGEILELKEGNQAIPRSWVKIRNGICLICPI
jgi:hypothetical protein